MRLGVPRRPALLTASGLSPLGCARSTRRHACRRRPALKNAAPDDWFSRNPLVSVDHARRCTCMGTSAAPAGGATIPHLAKLGALAILADRPAISECRCATLADACLLSVPAPERNQGSGLGGRGDGWHEGSAGLAAGDEQVRGTRWSRRAFVLARVSGFRELSFRPSHGRSPHRRKSYVAHDHLAEPSEG